MTTVRVGKGDYVYEVAEGWGRLPEGVRLVDVVGVGVDSQDNLFACTRGTHPIIAFSPAGQMIGSFGDGLFSRPHGFCVGPDDALYVADDVGQAVTKFSPDGRRLMTLGTPGKPADTGYDPNPVHPLRRVRWSAGPFAYPTNVAIGPAGDIFVSDGYGNARVHRFAADGQHLKSWGEPGDGPGEFWVPHGIAVDRQGTVYIADRENSRIQRFTSDGQYLGQWSPIGRPTQICIDRHGAIFVSEFGYRAGPYPQQRNPSGPPESWQHGRVSVRDAAGNALAWWGEGPDECAPGCFFAPHGVCTDSHGDLYVGEVIHSAGEAGKWVSADCHALQKFIRVR